MVRSEAAMTVMKRPREALEEEQEPVRDSRPRQEAASSSSGPVTQPRLPPTVAEPIGQDVNIDDKAEEEIQRGLERARDDQNYEEFMEELEGRVHREIDAVAGEGPPWYDTRTGALLNTKLLQEGMDHERASLEAFKVRTEVSEEEPKKAGVRPIRMGWVLSDRGATVKARMVACEVNHGEWCDAFAATPTSVAMRLALQRGMARGWTIFTADISTAFLHAVLDEDDLVYVLPPTTDRRPGHVWRLWRALYGLRRAPQYFQEHFAKKFLTIGYKRSVADPQLFVHPLTGVLIVAHVDDLLITCPPMMKDEIKASLDTLFKVKWGDELIESSWMKFLGKQWRRGQDCVRVRVPSTYFKNILDDHHLSECRSLSTPCMPQGACEDTSTPLEDQQAAAFRRDIGKLMWVLPERPDLAFGVRELSRHVQHPTQDNAGALKRVLRYIRGTQTMEMQLHIDPEENATEVVCHVDASWASTADRRSTSGGAIWVQGFLVCCWSRTQPTIAQSTCEAELTALNMGATEGKLVQTLLGEIGITASLRLCSDSLSAVKVTAKRGCGRMRHLEVKRLGSRRRRSRSTSRLSTSPESSTPQTSSRRRCWQRVSTCWAACWVCGSPRTRRSW